MLKKNLFIRKCYSIYNEYFRFKKRKLGYCGKNIHVAFPININNYKNVCLYDGVFLGSDCIISTTNAKFIMKEHAGAADRLMVRTGNHMLVLGKNFMDVTDEDKLQSGHINNYDKDVIIEENAWIGCNVTLLAGVVIGRGATIGAGAVVPKSIPPYSIAVGNPCKIVRFRWSIDEIIEHEKTLYSKEKRFTREQLEGIFQKYQK